MAERVQGVDAYYDVMIDLQATMPIPNRLIRAQRVPRR